MEKKHHVWPHQPVLTYYLQTYKPSSKLKKYPLKWKNSFMIDLSLIYRYLYWLVVEPPLWKIWVCQLGSLFTIYGKQCSKPPTSIDIYRTNSQFFTINHFLTRFHRAKNSNASPCACLSRRRCRCLRVQSRKLTVPQDFISWDCWLHQILRCLTIQTYSSGLR